MWDCVAGWRAVSFQIRMVQTLGEMESQYANSERISGLCFHAISLLICMLIFETCHMYGSKKNCMQK